tara:strand:+ start:3222 stop:3809 length:588 start_codon:yes stop_codon:yes gene_type:complete
MARTINANGVTNITGGDVYPIYMVALNFSTPVYVHSDVGTISHTPPFLGGNVDYIGVGDLGSVSAIPETTQIQANIINLTLSGINTNTISTAIQTDYQGKDCSIEIALRDTLANGGAILDTIVVFSGFIDNMTLNIGATATIRVNAVDKLVRFDKASNRRYNHADQRKEYPDDDAFIYQDSLKEQLLVWGGTRSV